jgi:hypothetical protein
MVQPPLEWKLRLEVYFDNSLLKAQSASIVLRVASFPLTNIKPNKEVILVALVMLLKELNDPGQNTEPFQL